MSRRPSIFRQRDVTKALRGAIAAGIQVARVEITKTGTITILPAGRDNGSNSDVQLDQELQEFEARHGEG